MRIYPGGTLPFLFTGLLFLAQASRGQDLDSLPIEVNARSLEALALLAPAAGQQQVPSPPIPPGLADARPLQIPSPPPRRPVDSRVVMAVIESRTGLVPRRVQVMLVDGRELQGTARLKSGATFELRSKETKAPRIVRYEDVTSVKVLPLSPGGRFVEAVEVVGLAAAAVAVAPLYFAWGLSCGFQCS